MNINILTYQKHYITVDDQNHIIDGWSNGPHPERDTTDAICLNEQGSYQFRLMPIGEENPSLYTMDGIPLYNWNGEQVIKRSDEEIEADRAEMIANQPTPEPTEIEKLRADLDYVMLMNGLDVDPN